MFLPMYELNIASSHCACHAGKLTQEALFISCSDVVERAMASCAGYKAAEGDGPAGVQGPQAAVPRPREAGELHDADGGVWHRTGAGIAAVQRPIWTGSGAGQLTMSS